MIVLSEAQFFFLLMVKLVCLSVLIQSIEYAQIHFQSKKSFHFILEILNSIICALIIISGMNYLLIFPLVMCAWRFYDYRGVFNGGSDYMTFIVLFASTVYAIFPKSEFAMNFCFWYVGLQLVLSYFVAGVVKIKNKKWRNGVALNEFLNQTNYSIPDFFKKISNNFRLIFSASWFVMIFECLFPLVFLSSKLAISMLIVAFTFHVMNYFVFGLNRFVFSWLAAYPALLFLCLK